MEEFYINNMSDEERMELIKKYKILVIGDAPLNEGEIKNTLENYERKTGKKIGIVLIGVGKECLTEAKAMLLNTLSKEPPMLVATDNQTSWKSIEEILEDYAQIPFRLEIAQEERVPIIFKKEKKLYKNFNKQFTPKPQHAKVKPIKWFAQRRK